MDVTPLIPHGRKIIQSYAGGAFKISGVQYFDAIVVFPTMVKEWQAPVEFSKLNETHFLNVIENASDIDVLLFGCGLKGAFLNPGLRGYLKSHGLVIDAMDTGAACRTYNVLMAEGRRVAAMLMPFGEKE